MTNWTLIQTFTNHTYSVYGLEFINEDTVASGDANGIIQIWSICSGETLRTITTATVWGIGSLQLVRNGLYLAAGLANINIYKFIHYVIGCHKHNDYE